jgi:two-component system, OmpR family, phosphate regulon response regulator PhoB
MQASYKVDPILKSCRILLVEDDKGQCDAIATYLRQEAFDVVAIADGLTALKVIRSTQNRDPSTAFNLIILDRILPGLGGLDVCRLLRQEGNLTPILMTSEHADEHDRVIGLEIGADDYLAKPFSERIFLARCRALLRRSRLWQLAVVPKVLKFKDLTLYVEECRATLGSQDLQLSPKEFMLLREFMESRGRVLSRDNLLERVWGDDYVGDAKTVDVHIRWLRQKLEADPSDPEYIKTLRGFGYRLGFIPDDSQTVS